MIARCQRCAVSREHYEGCIRCENCHRVWWWKDVRTVLTGNGTHSICDECLQSEEHDEC